MIALVHGADLGRGEAYGDHWIIITGFSADGNTAYVNDPDNQPANDRPGWIVGGVITLPTSTLSTGMFNAAAGPYAIIVKLDRHLARRGIRRWRRGPPSRCPVNERSGGNSAGSPTGWVACRRNAPAVATA